MNKDRKPGLRTLALYHRVLDMTDPTDFDEIQGIVELINLRMELMEPLTLEEREFVRREIQHRKEDN